MTDPRIFAAVNTLLRRAELPEIPEGLPAATDPIINPAKTPININDIPVIDGWRRLPDGTKQWVPDPTAPIPAAGTPSLPTPVPAEVRMGMKFVRKNFGDEAFGGFTIHSISRGNGTVRTVDPIPDHPENGGVFTWTDCELYPAVQDAPPE